MTTGAGDAWVLWTLAGSGLAAAAACVLLVVARRRRSKRLRVAGWALLALVVVASLAVANAFAWL